MELMLVFMFSLCAMDNIGSTDACFNHLEINKSLFTDEEIKL